MLIRKQLFPAYVVRMLQVPNAHQELGDLDEGDIIFLSTIPEMSDAAKAAICSALAGAKKFSLLSKFLPLVA
jgi:hypothetical protein